MGRWVSVLICKMLVKVMIPDFTTNKKAEKTQYLHFSCIDQRNEVTQQSAIPTLGETGEFRESQMKSAFVEQ